MKNYLSKNKTILIILIFSMILVGLIFSIIPFDGGDNLKYFYLSRSIQQGEYRDIWSLGQPIHAKYPPLFPLMLSICPDYLCCKFLIFGLFLLTVFFAYKLFEELKLPKYTILLFALSPLLLQYSHWVLSEIPYLLFSILALLCFYQKKYGTAFLFGLCAYFTRSIGLSLMIALSIAYWRQK